jgi:DNA-damage-inducible protein D
MANEFKLFEAIKHIDENGLEYGYARELAMILEYLQWRNFSKVLDRAMLAYKKGSNSILDHFAEVSKIDRITH